jgi:transcriptional regulator with XRE-family HTH domain
MAIGKLFIGRKVRELRAASNATQSQFAERIGISTSYLNQIENNQRPVSAAVLLALADKFQLDLAELSTVNPTGCCRHWRRRCRTRSSTIMRQACRN